MNKDNEKSMTLNIGVLVVLGFICLFLLIATLSSIYTIHAGERGVLLRFGKASDIAKSEGLHFKAPFIDEVVKMDIKTQKYEAKASAASEDLQTVSADVTVNYYITEGRVVEIYRTIGLGYQDKIIQPAVQEVVKASTAIYTAEELITKRPEIKDKIDAGLKERLGSYGIVVQDILITNFDFSASFNTAIEAKVTAEQNALAAKNKLAQVEYEAQQRVTQATAEAEAIKIQAQAIQSQGGKEYVSLKAIEKWDGRLPQYSLGGAVPFINVPTAQ